MKRKNHWRAGYTLIELSISLLVMSLIISTVMSSELQNNRVQQKLELNRKLDRIGAALYSYRLANNKLPCPGNASLARTNNYFGQQADGAAEACNMGGTIASNINTSGGDVFGGSVPVRTLGLPDDFAYDPWGNLFTYYVDKKANNPVNFTNSYGYGTYAFADTDKLNVQDESGATLNDSILAVVLSHGPNGHGAYNAAGKRVNAKSTNSYEQQNCMCDSSAAAVSTASLLIRIQRTMPASNTDPFSNFDDVARYYNKAYFYTYNERH